MIVRAGAESKSYREKAAAAQSVKFLPGKSADEGVFGDRHLRQGDGRATRRELNQVFTPGVRLTLQADTDHSMRPQKPRFLLQARNCEQAGLILCVAESSQFRTSVQWRKLPADVVHRAAHHLSQWADTFRHSHNQFIDAQIAGKERSVLPESVQATLRSRWQTATGEAIQIGFSPSVDVRVTFIEERHELLQKSAQSEEGFFILTRTLRNLRTQLRQPDFSGHRLGLELDPAHHFHSAGSQWAMA